MKTIITVSSMIMELLYIINCPAQQIFKDSDQQLGNSFSWDVKLGDLDGDGDLDAVVANFDGEDPSTQKNKIWLNNGDASFEESIQQLSSTSLVTLFDLNFDGFPDIIEHGWQENIMRVWINDNHANFVQSENYPFKGNLLIFDDKLNIDLITENSTPESIIQYEAVTLERRDSTILRIYTLLYNDSIRLRDSVIVDNYFATCMAVSDLNNDGYSDILLGPGGEIGPMIILFNDNEGNFTKGTQELGNYISTNIYPGDLNADGYPDLLQCNYHNPVPPNEIYPAKLYLNDGNGSFTETPLPYNSSYIAQGAAILDLDHDGDPDIYINHGHQHSGTSHKSEILFNDGNANFTSSTVNLETINSIATAFGDLDNDGDPDIFLACGDLELLAKPNRIWLNTTVDNPGSIVSNKKEGFGIYPNPNTGLFTIFYGTNPVQEAFIEIFDIEGNNILSKTINDTINFVVDLTGYPAGIYLVKVRIGSKTFAKLAVTHDTFTESGCTSLISY